MRRILFATLAAVLALPLTASLVLAHEKRTVGPYDLEVGFLNEPTYTDQANGVSLTVTEKGTDKAVEGLQDTVQVEVTAAGEHRTLRFEATEQAGQYVAGFVPTRATTYAFRIFGKMGSTDVNETFESGPGRFDEPQSVTTAQIPAKSETDQRLLNLQSAVDQTRLIALAALLLGAVGVGIGALRRRA